MKTLRFFLVFLAIFLCMKSNTKADNRGVINPGECRIENFAYNNQVDTYIFTGDQGKYAIISMSSQYKDGYSTIIPEVNIIGHDGQLIYHKSDTGTYQGHLLISDSQLPQTGTYTIQANPIMGTTGDYSLSLLIVPGSTEGGYICSGDTRVDSLECYADVNGYHFNGNEGQAVSINVGVVSGMTFAPEIYLCDPDGKVEISSTGFGPSIVAHQLLQSGIYTIFLTYNFNSYRDGLGDYNLTLALAPILDSDGDGTEDICDNCPDDFNPGRENCDGDELGDVCDPESCATTSVITTTISSTTTTSSGGTTSIFSSTTTVLSSTTTSRNNIIKCIIEIIFPDDQEKIELLGYYRDNLLSKTPEGREIIGLYYQWSPIIVRAMEEDEAFKEEVKELIDEVLPLIKETVE